MPIYIILLYGKDSVSSVSVIIAIIAAVHFSFIIIISHYHLCIREGSVENKIEDKICTAKRWSATVCSKWNIEQFEFEEYFQ